MENNNISRALGDAWNACFIFSTSLQTIIWNLYPDIQLHTDGQL